MMTGESFQCTTDDRFDKPFHRKHPRFRFHFDPHTARCRAGHRANRRHCHSLERRRAHRRHEVLHRGGTRERDAIRFRAPLKALAASAPHVPEPPSDRPPPLPPAHPGASARLAPDRGPLLPAQQHPFAARSCAAKASSKLSATYSLPIRSTLRCSASTAARVAAQSHKCAPAGIAGRPLKHPAAPGKSGHINARENQPVVGIQMSDGGVERCGSAAPRISIVGSSITPAPSARSCAKARRPVLSLASPPPVCRRAAAVIPVQLLRSRTTSPTITVAAASSRSPQSARERPSVPIKLCWSAAFPSAPPWRAFRPRGHAASVPAHLRKSRQPMKITSVSDCPTLLQSAASTSCPVTKVTADESPRCVSGTPEYAAIPAADVTPEPLRKRSRHPPVLQPLRRRARTGTGRRL